MPVCMYCGGVVSLSHTEHVACTCAYVLRRANGGVRARARRVHVRPVRAAIARRVPGSACGSRVPDGPAARGYAPACGECGLSAGRQLSCSEKRGK